MSAHETTKPIPTNDEVIDELTKDLESQYIPVEDEANLQEKEDIIPEDFDKSDTESEQNDIVPDDYIDEDALKELQSNLTEEEIVQHQQQALELKNKGNDEFKSGEYLTSIETYTEALKLCPLKYTNDRAILYSNRAASKTKLDRKKTAIDDCTKSIELNPEYLKSYLRRAKLNEETEKLDESLEDWKKILELDATNQEAKSASIRLPPLITERNEKMKTEMMGKLKDLGNLFLRPFGLSTENFKLQQDPSTGGYSVNFQQ